MAAQNANPAPWHDSMSDGCSCPKIFKPLMLPFRKDCLNHDAKYHNGGTWQDKERADTALYDEIYAHGWYGRMLAPWVYNGVRVGTYNYPPGHELRSWRKLSKAKSWNWATAS